MPADKTLKAEKLKNCYPQAETRRAGGVILSPGSERAQGVDTSLDLKAWGPKSGDSHTWLTVSRAQPPCLNLFLLLRPSLGRTICFTLPSAQMPAPMETASQTHPETTSYHACVVRQPRNHHGPRHDLVLKTLECHSPDRFKC